MIGKYMGHGVAAVTLVSMLGCGSPVPPQPKPSAIDTYLSLESECPEPKQVKELLPDYNPENAVASVDMNINLDGMIGSRRVRADTEYSLIVYNSKSKNNKIIEYGGREEFEQFLKNGEFDVIEFYEMNNVHQIHTIPSAVIYKTENIAYVILDLIGQDGLADGNFDAVLCPGGWEPNLLLKAGGVILKKRLEDSIKRGYPPQQQKPKVLKIA